MFASDTKKLKSVITDMLLSLLQRVTDTGRRVKRRNCAKLLLSEIEKREMELQKILMKFKASILYSNNHLITFL